MTPAQTYTKAKDGLQLPVYHWKAKNAKALILLVHGYAEHAMRYVHFAKFLNANNISLLSFDQRAHGKTESLAAYIHSFDQLLNDIDAVVNTIRTNEIPLFLMGHSMGGLEVTHYISRFNHPFQGVLLSAPALKASDDISSFMQFISKILGRIFPKLKTIALDSSSISRDPSVVKAYQNDPLVYSGKAYARTGYELLNAMSDVGALYEKIDGPLLIMHGTEDKIANPQSSQDLYNMVKSPDKRLIEYKGLYHEILNEPEKQKVMSDILTWIEDRI